MKSMNNRREVMPETKSGGMAADDWSFAVSRRDFRVASEKGDENSKQAIFQSAENGE